MSGTTRVARVNPAIDVQLGPVVKMQNHRLIRL